MYGPCIYKTVVDHSPYLIYQYPSSTIELLLSLAFGCLMTDTECNAIFLSLLIMERTGNWITAFSFVIVKFASRFSSVSLGKLKGLVIYMRPFVHCFDIQRCFCLLLFLWNIRTNGFTINLLN